MGGKKDSLAISTKIDVSSLDSVELSTLKNLGFFGGKGRYEGGIAHKFNPVKGGIILLLFNSLFLLSILILGKA